MHEREYVQESLSYVLRIQEVQERIKFEFVEILLAFISSWLVFYHTAHEQAEDNKDYLQDLRHKVQKVRILEEKKWGIIVNLCFIFRLVKILKVPGRKSQNLN